MYQELHRWDECIAVAQAKVPPVLSSPRCSQLRSTDVGNLLLPRGLQKLEQGWGWELGRWCPGGFPLLQWDWRSLEAAGQEEGM